MFDRKKSCLFFSILVAALAVGVTACGKRPVPEDEREVATVNGYKIIAADFATAVNPMADIELASAQGREAKQKILEDLITRKALVREAQKQDFDKQKAFMKEIERYWEQSLLKLLFRKKLEEFGRTVQVSDAELRKEYEHRSIRVFAEVILLSDAPSAAHLAASGEKFEQVKGTLKNKIVLDEGPRWWMASDLPSALEDRLFSLGSGALSPPVPYEDKWAVLRVLQKEGTGLASFPNVASGLRQELFERKKMEALEQWITDVRRRAVVKVDEDALKELDLKKIRGNL